VRHYPHLWISARGLGLSGTSTHLTRQLSGTHYGPLRHPSAPGLSLAGVRLIIPDPALGLPVLRALSWCTCCRHYPGARCAGRPGDPFRGRLRRLGETSEEYTQLLRSCRSLPSGADATLQLRPRRPFRDPMTCCAWRLIPHQSEDRYRPFRWN
jgi:hypothetical protein